MTNEKTEKQSTTVAADVRETKIRTYAILSASNAMNDGLQKSSDDCINEKLMKYLKYGYFVWFPIMRKNDAKGDSLIIYNITLNDTLHIGEKYEQSILWCDNVSGEKQYWEKNDKGDFTDTHSHDDVAGMNEEELNEMLALHNDILARTISHNLTRYGFDESYETRKVSIMLSDKSSGRGKYEARGSLYCGYRKH